MMSTGMKPLRVGSSHHPERLIHYRRSSVDTGKGGVLTGDGECAKISMMIPITTDKAFGRLRIPQSRMLLRNLG